MELDYGYRDYGARVDAHVIPGACAQVIPQVVGPW
jgi:hypothetical protein